MWRMRRQIIASKDPECCRSLRILQNVGDGLRVGAGRLVANASSLRAKRGEGEGRLRTRDPFGEVLEALRRRIREGQLAPGAPLIVMDLAADLDVSATPVREALAHLAGEGLVGGRHGQVRGYFVWTASPSDLSDLLRLHQAQVLIAVAQAPAHATFMRDPSPALDGADPVALAEAYFAARVSAGGGPVLMRAHLQVADRLHLLRRRESRVLPDVAAELADLVGAEPGPEAAARLRAYHRRRLGAVVRLAALLG